MSIHAAPEIRLPEEVPFKAEGPQPLVREIFPGEAYPVTALGPLRTVVEAVQGQTQAPVAIPAASALSVASLAVQGFRDVETLGGDRPLSLYALTVAQSGERKSSCDAPLMAALRSYEKEQHDTRRDELASWEAQHALWKGDRDRILADAKKNDRRAGAEANLANLGPEPAAPPSTDRTVTEPTYEGLTRKFAEGMPTLGIFSDEGGQFLGGFAMSSDNRQKTLAALNDLMVQPGVARTFMADPMSADTGFLPRFLVSEPPSTIGTRFQANARKDNEALADFGAQLASILRTPLPMDEKTRELIPVTLPLSSAARVLLSAYSDALEAGQASCGEYANITGYASKSAEQAARIAGVMTAWENLHATEVRPETMADAITLAQFYLSEAKRLSDAANVSEKIGVAETLRKWLLEAWPHPEVLPSDVVQRAPIRALRESPAARAAIAVLEDHGWLVRLPKNAVVRGIARKEAYRIVRAER
jgi:hypothetical protein